MIGGVLSWLAERWSARLVRWISLIAIGIDFALAAIVWVGKASHATGRWLDEVDCAWVPGLGIHFHLAVDGLSLLMLALTLFLGIVAVLASWTEIQEKVGFFHFNLMWVLAGISGVFLAIDLFLFYFAWELMLVPMYFLIVGPRAKGLCGREVFSIYTMQRAPDVDCHPGALLYPSQIHRRLHLRIFGTVDHAPKSPRRH